MYNKQIAEINRQYQKDIIKIWTCQGTLLEKTTRSAERAKQLKNDLYQLYSANIKEYKKLCANCKGRGKASTNNIEYKCPVCKGRGRVKGDNK